MNGFSVNQDSTKIEALGKRSLTIVYSNPDSAKWYAEQAITLCNSSGNESMLGLSHNYLGICYDVMGLFDSAHLQYNIAADYAIQHKNPVTLAASYNNLGLLWWNKSELDKASEYFFKSSEIYDSLGNKRGVANTFSNIALIFEDQRRPHDALKYTRKALSLREELDDTLNLGRSYSNLGLLLGELGLYDSSMYYQRKALPFFVRTNNKYGLSSCYQNFGTDFHLRNNYDSALVYAQLALKTRESIGNKRLIAASESLVGNVLASMQRFNESITFYSRARDHFKELENESELWKVYSRMSAIYDSLGDTKMALASLRNRLDITDTLHQREKVEALYEAEARFETQKAEKELLEANNKLLLENQRRQRLVLVLTVVLALVILAIVLIRMRLETINSAKKRELLEQKLSISRDLHDSVGSQLTYVNKKLQLLDDSGDSELSEVKHFTQKAISDLRNAIWGMSKELTGADVATRLADVVRSAQSESLQIKFVQDVSAAEFNPTVAVNLLRIGQEAIQNSVKHSGGKNMLVELVVKENHWSLCVTDDGIWAPNDNEGFGLHFMQERADRIKGTLKVEKSEKGTVVCVTNKANAEV